MNRAEFEQLSKRQLLPECWKNIVEPIYINKRSNESDEDWYHNNYNEIHSAILAFEVGWYKASFENMSDVMEYWKKLYYDELKKTTELQKRINDLTNG